MRLMALAGGWLLGLFIGSKAGAPVAVFIATLPIALLLAIALRRHWRVLLAALFVAGALAGALRFELLRDHESSETLAALNGGPPIEIKGVVVGFPESAGSVSRFRVSAREALVDGRWRPASGQVQVSARKSRGLAERREPPFFRTGDLLRLRGPLKAPQGFADFDFPAYLAQQGARSVMEFPRVTLVAEDQGPWAQRALFRLRARLSRALSRTLPEPENGVAQAILLGVRSETPRDVADDFQASGTSHLLAISGLHAGIIMGLALLVTRRLLWRPQLLVYLTPAAVVWLYALIAGLPPSAERAAVMGSFYLAALYFGRQRHGLEALLLAAAAITAFDPRALWQVSFQLSFLAMAGIVLAMPMLQDYVSAGARERDDVVSSALRGVVALAAMSAAATVFVLPAVAFYFHRVSLVGVPASVLTLPLMPLALTSAALTAVAGLASSQAAWLFGWAAWAGVGAIVWTVQFFAALPVASIGVGDVARGLVFGYYAGLGLAVWALRSAGAGALRGWRPGLQAARRLLAVRIAGLPAVTRYQAAALAIALAAGAVWVAAAHQPARVLEVSFFAVGQGDAIFIETPSQHTILVDGGPDPRLIVRDLDSRLPALDRRIDLVVLTHPQEDHIAGLVEVLRRYDVGQVLDPDTAYDSAAYAELRTEAERQGIPRTVARDGERIKAGDVTIEVLHPPARHLAGTGSDVNNNSVVLWTQK